MKEAKYILARGAGDLATGTIRRLFIAGFNVVATELEKPLSVRRLASFSEAVYVERIAVEGVTAVLSDSSRFESDLERGLVPVIVDDGAEIRNARNFDVIIDARMAKRKLDTKISDAPVVVGIGPGFEAGMDCHAVVETLAGENLGRVIYSGKAAENTGVPMEFDLELVATRKDSEKYGKKDLVLFAENDGVFHAEKKIAGQVKAGDLIAFCGETPITSKATGVLRGLLHSDTVVKKGTKLVEIDPSGDASRCCRVSAKSNAVAGGVLEAVFSLIKGKTGR